MCRSTTNNVGNAISSNSNILSLSTASTHLRQLHGILKAIYSRGGITGLSHILSSQPYAWPLATHLSPTKSGINNDETYGNVALPTPSCEYYVHTIEANVAATVSIYHPGEEHGILFCSVAAYDVHGNPLLGDDKEYDQLTPLPGESATKTWTGPIILVARYYKSSDLRCQWVSQINKEWSLPTIILSNTNNAQKQRQYQRYLPVASVKQQQAFTNRIQFLSGIPQFHYDMIQEESNEKLTLSNLYFDRDNIPTMPTLQHYQKRNLIRQQHDSHCISTFE